MVNVAQQAELPVVVRAVEGSSPFVHPSRNLSKVSIISNEISVLTWYSFSMEKDSKSFELAKKLLGKEVQVNVDRPIGSKHPRHGFEYKANYGFIEGVKAPDGEDLDAYFLGASEPIDSAKGICIAIAHRRDNDDDKLIVVPNGINMSDKEIISAIHFQEQWFDTEIIRRSL